MSIGTLLCLIGLSFICGCQHIQIRRLQEKVNNLENYIVER